LLEAVDLRFSYRADARRAGPSSWRAGPSGPAYHPVIDNVSLRIDRGGLVGLLGPNGSGKTTMLRLLSGTLTPQSGVVRLDGQDLGSIPRGQLAQRLAVVPQETQLAFDYTALEIVLMGRYPHLGAFEVEGPADLASACRALDATGTRALADRQFHTLSGGEKQRVIIASALAQLDPAAHDGSSRPSRSRLLFLDEPTASLDLRYQIEVASLIADLHDRHDITVLLSTHDLHFARTVCTAVVLLGAGRIIDFGPPDTVLTAGALAGLYGIDAAVAAPLLGR
jgi:iron complex transport system ATP-binding protein